MSLQAATELDWMTELRAQWCESFRIFPVGPNAWTIATPFADPDGSLQSVLITRASDGWTLSDGGSTADRFQLDEFQLSPAAESVMHRLASQINGEWIDNEFRTSIGDRPDIGRITDFAQLLIEARAVPPIRERSSSNDEQYRTTARDALQSRLIDREIASRQWADPAHDPNGLFKADLHLAVPDSDVVLFFAAAAEKVSNSTLTAMQYRLWELSVTPVLIYRPRESLSTTIDRAAVSLDPENVVALDDPHRELSLRPALRRLEQLNVPLGDAA